MLVTNTKGHPDDQPNGPCANCGDIGFSMTTMYYPKADQHVTTCEKCTNWLKATFPKKD